MDKNEEMRDFKIVTVDHKTRTFGCKLLEDTPYYRTLSSERQIIVELVRFAPGKNLKDYVEFYRDIDKRLLEKYGKTRCDLDIHETLTFLTAGPYDMIALWDAPDIATFNEILGPMMHDSGLGDSASLIASAPVSHKPAYGDSTNLVASAPVSHKPVYGDSTNLVASAPVSHKPIYGDSTSLIASAPVGHKLDHGDSTNLVASAPVGHKPVYGNSTSLIASGPVSHKRA